MAAKVTLPKSCTPSDVPALKSRPSKLFLETTTACNLACPMCPKQSWEKGATGVFDPALFSQLESVLSDIEALILNGIGEPLLDRHLETYISRAKKAMPEQGWVGFQSNGILLTEKRAASLIGAGLDTICLSLSAVSHGVFRNVHAGSDMKRLERSFTLIEKAKRAAGASRFRIGMEFVVMRDTLLELPAALRWAAKRGAQYAIVSHLLPYNASMVPQTAYDILKDSARNLFAEWKRRAREKGINLERYPEVYMKYKYIRSPKDEKLVSFVEEMKAEAISQGIFLNLEALFSSDDGMLNAVQKVFDQARIIAQQEGIELRLPNIVPRSERKCEFVEEGGVFVSRDGSVHPCYFLWHRGEAHLGGRKQQITPIIFGNLRERSLEEIWNDPAYRTFRENVISYNYPYCHNCSFALCDLVQREPFERDCYFNTEPCASCLWCMGMFQCLK